MSSLIASC